MLEINSSKYVEKWDHLLDCILHVHKVYSTLNLISVILNCNFVYFFQCVLTLILLFIKDVYALINYVSYVEALFTLLSVSGLLWLRYKQPKTERPIRVNLALPIIFLIICLFLVISSVFQSPIEVGVGTAIIISGIPVYYMTIHRPVEWLTNTSQAINMWCSKFFICMPNQEKFD